MSNEHNEQEWSSGIDVWSLVSFAKGLFVVAVWFAFVVMILSFIASLSVPYRESTPILDAIYLASGFIIVSTIIVVLQFNRLNNSLKEIKKAIEEKQPVIIQRREHSPEQNRQ